MRADISEHTYEGRYCICELTYESTHMTAHILEHTKERAHRRKHTYERTHMRAIGEHT